MKANLKKFIDESSEHNPPVTIFLRCDRELKKKIAKFAISKKMTINKAVNMAVLYFLQSLDEK